MALIFAAAIAACPLIEQARPNFERVRSPNPTHYPTSELPPPELYREPYVCDSITVNLSSTVTRWCWLWEDALSVHGPVDEHAVRWGLTTMACESSGDPDAVNQAEKTRGVPRHRLAAGLMQHMPAFWSERSTAAGVPAVSIFDPWANLTVAAWLYRRAGPGHWPTCGQGGGG